MLAIITPAKNEGQNLLKLSEQLLAQKLLPDLWIIVDDNSNDCTPAIIKKLENSYGFIHGIRLERKRTYNEVTNYGSVIQAGFDFALEQEIKPDFLGILDADMRLSKHYYEIILNSLKNNPNVGVASGIFYELTTQESHIPAQIMARPVIDVCGADMVFRRECLLSIGGFPTCPRPDTVAQLKIANRHWLIGVVTNTYGIHLRGNYSLQKFFKLGCAYRALGYNLIVALLYVPITTLSTFSLAPVGFVIGYFSTINKVKKVSDMEARKYFYESLFRSVYSFVGFLTGKRLNYDIIKTSTKSIS